MAGLGLEFTTPGSAARPAAEREEEAQNLLLSLFIKYTSLRPSETFFGYKLKEEMKTASSALENNLQTRHSEFFVFSW